MFFVSWLSQISFVRDGGTYKSTLLADVWPRVVFEGKGATPQEDVGSDSSSELLAKIVAVMEGKFRISKTLRFDK